ncbi:hypothetical protein ACGFNU_47110 [Spirillospora sp. NPDC048911]|uniref:hypothetical protein n=1 Tax=Spirillospora sp. NPDC048911 TaxID=3364527 RepID=UPI00371FF36F
MPTLYRRRRPAWPRAALAGRASWMNQAWPTAITLTAAIVFILFLVQATLAAALLMAVVTLLAGGILLTLVSGTAWIGQLRELPAGLRRRH